MNSVIKSFRQFFKPLTWAYSYNLPKDVVITRIQEVLKKEVTILGTQDFEGEFTGSDNFKMKIVIGFITGGYMYRSTLFCKIERGEDDKTIIKTTAKPALVLYLMFLFFIALAFIGLYDFMRTSSSDILFRLLPISIIAPFIIVWFAGLSNYSIQERFVRYIHKPLKFENLAEENKSNIRSAKL